MPLLVLVIGDDGGVISATTLPPLARSVMMSFYLWHRGGRWWLWWWWWRWLICLSLDIEIVCFCFGWSPLESTVFLYTLNTWYYMDLFSFWIALNMPAVKICAFCREISKRRDWHFCVVWVCRIVTVQAIRHTNSIRVRSELYRLFVQMMANVSDACFDPCCH